MRLRRLLFWSILSASLLTGGWWVLHTPYRPDSVLTAIPAEATFVSIHDNLAAGLPALMENHLLRSTLISAGVKETDIDDLTSNKSTREWLTRLAGDRTVIAYVPSLGYQQKPAWVFASWIGNQSQKLRWKLFWFRPKTIRQSATEYGRIVYNVKLRLPTPRQRLSVSLTEGVLVGCVSEDPTAARYLVQNFDRQYRRQSIISDGTFSAATKMIPSSPHWGWIKMRHDRPLIAYTVNTQNKSKVEVSMATQGILPPADNLTTNETITPLLQTLGNSPDGAIFIPIAWIRTLMPNTQTIPLWADSLQPLWETNRAPSLAFVGILDRAHSGRIRGPLGASLTPFIKGLRVPTLILGLQIANKDEASQKIGRILEQLNSRYNLGLNSKAIQTPDGTVNLIEETRKNLYRKFEPDERVAWTYKQGWMLIASNAGILKRLMAVSPQTTPDCSYAPWTTANQPVEASLWIDASATSRLFKDAISVVTIALMASNSESTKETRQKLEVARQWLEKTQNISDISIFSRSSNSVVRLDLSLGATGTEN